MIQYDIDIDIAIPKESLLIILNYIKKLNKFEFYIKNKKVIIYYDEKYELLYYIKY